MTYNLIVEGMNGSIDVYNREYRIQKSTTQKGAEFIIKFSIY